MNGQPIVSSLTAVVDDSPPKRLEYLFDCHYDRLYRLARRLSVNSDDALDLVQETFLRAAHSPNSVPFGSSNEEAWLVRVLINIQRDQWRKKSVRERYLRKAFSDRKPDVDRQDPAMVLMAKTTVWAALGRLTPRRRAVVVMHELEGLSVSAIADLLGINAVTARCHLSLGRRDLAKALKALYRRNQ